MKGMSERQYAAHAGVSRGAIQKARAAGRLVLYADGSIDAVASDARRAAATDPAKQRVTPKADPLPPPTQRPKPMADGGTVAPEPGGPLANASPDQYLRARTANEVIRVKTNNLRLQRMQGELIDRARATALVFKLARQERDSWLNLPARVAAQMAAELGVDAATLQTVLEKYIRQHLSELSDVKISFR